MKESGDKDAMGRSSAELSKWSNNVVKGAIGAIDCWLVRIVCPSWFRDTTKNNNLFL